MGVRFKTGIANTQMPAATGIQDIVSPDFVGRASEIKCALVIVSRVPDLSDTRADSAAFSFGITDGTNTRCIGNYAEDNANPSVAVSTSVNGELGRVYTDTGGTVDYAFSFVSFINNGIRVNWSAVSASTHYVTVLLFSGSNVSALVGDVTLTPAPGSTINTGFEPKVVFCISAVNSFDVSPSPVADLIASIGMAAATGVTEQGTFGADFQDGTAAGTARVRASQNVCVDGFVAQGVISNWTDSSFRINRGAVLDIDTAYLAIGIENAEATVQQIAVPTSVGQVDISFGFRPSFVFGIATTSASEGSLRQNSEAGYIGWGFANSRTQIAFSQTFEDTTSPANCYGQADDSHFILAWNDILKGSTARVYSASLADITDDGVTLSFDSVFTTTRIAYILGIQEDPIGVGRVFIS